MAGAWGLSWGTSWGNSWGAIAGAAEERQLGGWLPLKYVRNGKIVDSPVPPKEVPLPLELDSPIVIPPEIVASFFMPPDMRPDLYRELANTRLQLRQATRKMQEEEDIAVALLLS